MKRNPRNTIAPGGNSFVHLQSKVLRKTTLITLIFLAALVTWVPRQISMSQARQALAEARRQTVAINERVAAATVALETARLKGHAQYMSRDQALAAVAKAERDLAKTEPESRWITPPASWPEWNPESPYIWIRKEIVPQFPVGVFSGDGTLRAEIAALIAPSESQLRALNATLPRLLAEYRKLERAQAQRIDHDISDVANGGAKVTIRVQPLPEEGGRLKDRFGAALRDELGEQRVDLIMKVANGWLNEQFGQAGARDITVRRNANGRYYLDITGTGGTGGLGTSVDSLNKIDDYVPPYLVKMFEEAFYQPSSIVAPRTEQ
jgi:hypothetical protein